MRTLGELCLLAAFVASGYAAFACTVGRRSRHLAVLRSGLAAVAGCIAALTVTLGVLAWALLSKDFSFDYVVQYSSSLLVWNYSLSALWVGQAGSLLLWAWILAALAMFFRFWPRQPASELRDTALGILMAYVCFLLAIMVFAADPMKASIVAAQEGAGLSPLLQHPAMMIHPPVVFSGYAAWAVPFALAAAALITGRLDTQWVQQARPWALAAWVVLGIGILLGAYWSYEELGWGGYWGWDPVENGSLIPWLTGTALIHSLMVWRYRGGLKRTALALAFVTFGLCNFATFLTRSGIFSSLHAFSQSPIGWMFLVLMFVLVVAGTGLIVLRRQSLVSKRRLRSLWARESLVVMSAVLLLLLTTVIVAGTLALPLSTYLLGWSAVVGPEFYNAVLVPIGLLLLATTAAVPLLRWGGPPTPVQKKMLLLSAGAGLVAVAVAFVFGVRHPVSLLVAMMSAVTVVSFAAALLIEAQRRSSASYTTGLVRALLNNRRQYCGYLIHLGFVCVAIGVTGSALATRRHEAVMKEGETLDWAGRRIRYARLIQRELPDKLVAEAELEISTGGGQAYKLLPARHLHLLQEQWTTEVAIHSTWGSDFYTILNSGEGGGVVSLTFVENPMMRWLWFGGCVISAGALVSLWPAGARKAKRSGMTIGVHKQASRTEINRRRAA